MPAHIHAFPVSATNIKLKDSKGETYPITLDTDTFNRTGEDGDIPILPLNGGDEFSTDILGGSWHKGWDNNIDTFTASIDSGILRLTGVANQPIPLLDELELTVSMESPIDDTGTVNRDIRLWFYLTQDKTENDPSTDDNRLDIQLYVNDTGIIYLIEKKVGGAATETLASGYDYTMDTTHSTGDLEATIWRLVFNGKPGTTGATMSVYLKQSDTLANAESATEHEVTGSPFDVSDLEFNIGYPAYRINTKNATYFGTAYDSANRAASGYLRVTYPTQFKTCYDFTPSDYGKADVCLFDGDPDSGGVRVYDKDHTFTDDAYLQNGLIRIQIDTAVQYGLKLYGYIGGSWIQPMNAIRPRLDDSGVNISYPELLSIETDPSNPESITLKVRLRDSATLDLNYYADYEITLKRGSYSMEMECIGVVPTQDVRFGYFNTPTLRFGYAGDDEIGDDDINESGINTTLSDNFMIAFDDEGDAVLAGYTVNKKPTGTARFWANDGGELFFDNVDQADLLSTKFWLYIVPFNDVANLFVEAEDATLGGGASVVVDAAASDGQAVKIDQTVNRFCRYDITAGTTLPAGRYLAVYRARQVDVEDAKIYAFNITDSEYRNKEGTMVKIILTGSYSYYRVFFDIFDEDVSGGDTIALFFEKDDADTDEIRIDYFLIIPLSDGMNLPLDLAHNPLRSITQHPRLCVR